MSKKKVSNKEISIDHEDDQSGYDEFSQFLEDHTERQKEKYASEIVNMGEDFLAEIDHKMKMRQEQKKPLIKYITKKSSKYSEKYLLDLDFRDVNDIYDEIKYENRSVIKKFFEFLGF